MKNDYSPSNGVSTAKGAASILDDASRIHQKPPSVRAFSKAEKNLWNYLMKARPYKEWTPTDLLLASRVVLLDTVIKKGEERLFQMISEGADILDPQSYSNEYNFEIIKMQKLQLTYLRALGMTRSSVRNTESGSNSRATRERELAETLGMFGEQALGLPSFMAKS